jgi:hypothetical protein
MSIFGNTNLQQGGPAEGVNRLARCVGRLLLWGCVLLLLIRGIVFYLGADSDTATATRRAGVTVTRPAGSPSSHAEGK